MDTETRFNELIDALKNREYRLTPQRVELVRLIARSEGHPSASMLHTRINKRFPTMSLATVYKTLALLKDMNQVVEINLPHDSHYDGNQPDPHAHLVCTRCNRIMDGHFTLDQDGIRQLEQESGFKDVRPQLSFFGLCPTCQAERN